MIYIDDQIIQYHSLINRWLKRFKLNVLKIPLDKLDTLKTKFSTYLANFMKRFRVLCEDNLDEIISECKMFIPINNLNQV